MSDLVTARAPGECREKKEVEEMEGKKTEEPGAHPSAKHMENERVLKSMLPLSSHQIIAGSGEARNCRSALQGVRLCLRHNPNATQQTDSSRVSASDKQIACSLSTSRRPFGFLIK